MLISYLETIVKFAKGTMQRGEKNFGDAEERKVRSVRNSDGAPLHAQSRDTKFFLFEMCYNK